uniref:Uncharacterized protein n=1 Tax=Setaria italica TaxID=4555 RepID=K3Y3X1_SETIT
MDSMKSRHGGSLSWTASAIEQDFTFVNLRRRSRMTAELNGR